MHAVSTRNVDDLVKALGGDTRISKSEVSRICGVLDAELSVFRTRPLDRTRFPYVYLDATYCKARVNHQIVSQAVVIATGITEDGGREVLGLMVGDSETEAFWSEFLRSLRTRGLNGARLAIADHHLGLVKAVRKVMLGAGYQRCRVHFLRNVFAVIPKDSGEMVAVTIRTIFAQPTAEAVRTQLLILSGCCRLVGQFQSGAGEAAIDQVRAVLDVPQAAAEDAFEVVVIGEGDVGQRAAPQQRPHALHRVQVWCIGWQLHDGEPVVLVRILTHPGGPMGVEIVPDEDDGGPELDVSTHDQVAVIGPGETIASRTPVLVVPPRPVDQPGGLARPVTAQGGDRVAAPGPAAHPHHRRLPATPPGAGPRGSHAKARLVLEDDEGSQRRRSHSACGHTSFFHN